MMSKAFLLDYQIDLIEILSKRGASFNIPNKDNVTANQLRLNLRENQGKCGELCDRL